MFDLNEWMVNKKLSDYQLACITDVSRSTIAAVRNGNNIYDTSIRKICKGINRPYRPEEWPNKIINRYKDQNKIEPEFTSFNKNKIKRKVKIGMDLTVSVVSPQSTGSGKKQAICMDVTGVVLDKTEHLVLLSLPIGSANIRSCYSYFDIKDCKEILN